MAGAMAPTLGMLFCIPPSPPMAPAEVVELVVATLPAEYTGESNQFKHKMLSSSNFVRVCNIYFLFLRKTIV